MCTCGTDLNFQAGRIELRRANKKVESSLYQFIFFFFFTEAGGWWKFGQPLFIIVFFSFFLKMSCDGENKWACRGVEILDDNKNKCHHYDY